MSDVWTDALPYFTRKELACKGSGVIKLDMRFAAALPDLRRAWGEPLHPTSVCRTPAHNLAEGGASGSWHLTENPERPSHGCMAADIRWRDWPTEKKMAFARRAYKMGWAVGLHDGFCHIDRRGDCDGWRKTVFIYGTWSGAFSKEDVF
jgi:hypothetical protein